MNGAAMFISVYSVVSSTTLFGSDYSHWKGYYFTELVHCILHRCFGLSRYQKYLWDCKFITFL